MRMMAVTPLLPHADAINAGPLVMYHHLVCLAERHDVTLATLAGPDPAERGLLHDLSALGISVHAVWRQPPPRLVRRSKLLDRFIPAPEPREWARQEGTWAATDPHVLLEPTRRLRIRRRAQQLEKWVHGTHPLRALQFWEPAMQALLDRILATGTFDLIHVEDTAMGSYRYEFSKPRVLTDHEVRAESPAPIEPKNGWIQSAIADADLRRWRTFQPRVWNEFDRIQVFTEEDAAEIRRRVPKLTGRVDVNPFGVELPRPARPDREDADLVVFVAGFAHLPNVDAAIWLGHEIWPRIRARHASGRLAIVGSYPPPPVRALAGSDVVVTGHVPSVEPYLEQAAVVLSPLRSGGGMRLKVLQAMALGKPVVTTPLGARGLRVDGRDPPLAVASDADAIAAATVKLLLAQDARRALGTRARAFAAEHFSWDAYSHRLAAMYDRLLGNSRATSK